MSPLPPEPPQLQLKKQPASPMVLSLMFMLFSLIMGLVLGCTPAQSQEAERAAAIVAAAEGEALGAVNPFPGNLPLLEPEEPTDQPGPAPGPPPMPDDGPEVYRSGSSQPHTHEFKDMAHVGDLIELAKLVKKLEARVAQIEQHGICRCTEEPLAAGAEGGGGLPVATNPEPAASAAPQDILPDETQADSVPPQITWVSEEEAVASPLPVMVYFTLPDGQCPHCVVLEREVLSHPAVIQASQSRACVKVVGRGHTWAIKYADSWPTLVFWSGDGFEGSLVGSRTSVDDVLSYLQGD